jgi:NAD(P)-dependent dehydrogenase (short-subunit alcohol dehydrogenase family)
VTHAQTTTPRWALILGASSGFGEGVAKVLAGAGYDIAGVHLDRKAGIAHVGEIKADITALGRRVLFFNVNAADAAKRDEVLDALAADAAEQGGGVAVLLHSLAFGALKPYTGAEMIDQKQMEMTLDVMAHSLVYWTQGLVRRGLLGSGGRVFSMTSSGSTRVIPAYGAVSAAKCARESHTRQLASELAAHRIAVNALRAGITDTPALRKIPGHDRLLETATRRNPSGRLTTPADVAGAILALCHPGADWITGNVINVDGGEEITG